MKTTISALYDNRADAVDAVRALQDNNGVLRNDISMMASDAAGEYHEYHGRDMPDDDTVDDTMEGAASGALLGGAGGLLVGLAALAIPGIGPIIAAGPIAVAIAGAGIGAVTGGIIGALVDLGVDEERAGYYAEGVRRGGTLVTVHVDERVAADVTDTLETYDPVDLEGRVDHWREEGWTAYDPQAKPYNVDQIERDRLRY